MTIMTKRGSLDNIVTYEHICDTPEDLDNINKKESTLGSTALVLQDEGGIGIYIANSAGEWIYASGGNKGEQTPAMTIHVCSSSEVDSETGFPTISEPIENMLYLVPAQDPSSGNLYDEYVYLNNAWEKFGSGQVAAAVQADWQENDSTAASYVQNRPGAYEVIHMPSVQYESLGPCAPESADNAVLWRADFDPTPEFAAWCEAAKTNPQTLYIRLTDQQGNDTELVEQISFSSEMSTSSMQCYASVGGSSDSTNTIVNFPSNTNIYVEIYQSYNNDEIIGYVVTVYFKESTIQFDNMHIGLDYGKTVYKISEKYLELPELDWDNNDANTAGYIKNKPGGYTIIDNTWTTVAETDSATWTYGDYSWAVDLNFDPSNTVQWRLTFDNDTPIELNSIVDVSDGHGYSYEIHPDNQTECHYIYIYYNGTNHYISGVTIDSESSTGPSTIKIEVKMANIVKIDSKFLPDMLSVTLVADKTSVIFNDNTSVGDGFNNVYTIYTPNIIDARYSQIFGYNHKISGGFNFVTGAGHTVVGNERFSFFEGQNNYATYGDSMGQWYGTSNHFEGLSNRASASIGGHIEGICNEMGSDGGLRYGMHVMGIGNNQGSQIADGAYVAGRASNPSSNNVETIGNGTYSLSQTKNSDGLSVYTLSNVTRSNARTLDWSGNEWLAGNLTVAGGSLILNTTTLNESSLQQLLGTSTTLNIMQNRISGVEAQAYSTLPNSIQARTQIEEIYLYDNDSDYAGYITTSGVTVNTTPTADSSWVHVIESCSEGDCFAVTGQAGSNARLWCFVDASGNNLKARANLSTWVENEKIIAPPGASSLIVNFLKSRSHRLLRGWPADQYGTELAIQQLAAAISGNGVFISQQPQNVTATVGDTVSFSIDTIGIPTKYQWQYLTTAADWRDSGLSGFNTKTITMEATGQRNKTFWRCIVDDTIISNEAFLTVSASNG